MTIEEASNLVLNAYKISKGGEIFLLDMGQPIKLNELAKLMIQFSGKTIKEKGKGDIEIKVIGLRKGEKLYEELLVDEKSKITKINQIYESLEKKISINEFQSLLKKIERVCTNENVKELYKILNNQYINYNKNEK